MDEQASFDYYTRNILPWDRERIVFLHVPKTGGTTLSALLVKAVDASEVCPVQFNELPLMTAGRIAQYRVFSGHFDRRSINVIPGMRKIVTLLREPRARIISTYRYWRAIAREVAVQQKMLHVLAAIDLDFADFLRKIQSIAIHDVDNMYARIFGGVLPMRGDPPDILTWPLDKFGGEERLVSEAKKFLDNCAAVGILEEFETSVQLIFDALNLPLLQGKILPKMVTEDVARSNNRLSAVAEFSINQDAEVQLDQLTRCDREIYEYAKKIFEERKISYRVVIPQRS